MYALQLFADSVDHTATVPAAVARAQLPSDNVTLDLGGILMDLQDNSQLNLAPRLTTAHTTSVLSHTTATNATAFQFCASLNLLSKLNWMDVILVCATYLLAGCIGIRANFF